MKLRDIYKQINRPVDSVDQMIILVIVIVIVYVLRISFQLSILYYLNFFVHINFNNIGDKLNLKYISNFIDFEERRNVKKSTLGVCLKFYIFHKKFIQHSTEEVKLNISYCKGKSLPHSFIPRIN